MSSKTKIVVFKARELIYTGIFILLGILLILLLVFMFIPSHKSSKKSKETSGYAQGVYTSPLKLGENEIFNYVYFIEDIIILNIYLSLGIDINKIEYVSYNYCYYDITKLI